MQLLNLHLILGLLLFLAQACEEQLDEVDAPANVQIVSQIQDNEELLWDKAVAIAKSNEGWMPASWHEKEIIYNSKGKVDETYDYLFSLGFTSDFELDVQLLRATKNGQDYRDEVLEELKTKSEEFERERSEDNPFDPAYQQSVKLTPTSDVKKIGEHTCVAFSYTQTTENGIWQGIAWLDRETGMPVEVESRPSILPIEEDGLEVNSITSTTRYNVSALDAWYPLEIHVDATFKAKYGIFSYEGQSQTVVTLSNYERLF